jgi:PPE-repeat protein
MDYGAMPPEFNSTRMYTGPGSGPMLEAAAGWDALAGELRSAASAYGSAIESLSSGPWIGPSSTAMAAAAMPYVAWMSVTAEQAEMSGAQAAAAASAFEQAFAMTVPPPVVLENRVQLMILTATNILGQNTAAIAANEADYAEMWAQDAVAMYGYAASAVSAASGVTPFLPAPETTSATGLATQAASGLQAAGSSMGGAQSALSQFVTAVPSALNGLAQPGSATTGSSGIFGGSSASASPADSTSAFGNIFGQLDSSGIGQSLVAQYAGMPGLFGLFTATNALAPLMNPGLWLQFSQVAAQQAAQGAAAAAQAAGAGAAPFFGGLGGGLAGIGQAAAVGGLSVPGTWGWAAAGPSSLLGGLPMAAPLATVDPAMAAGLGMPMMMGGGGAGQGGAAVGGTAKGKYGLPLTSVMTRPPSAGYGPAPTGPGAAAYPVPPGYPINGHAPPGYQPAIVYVPTAASN